MKTHCKYGHERIETSDGWCRECRRAANRASYYRHREKRMAHMREARAVDPTIDRARCAAWRERNAEYKREIDRAYYVANREQIKERSARYVAANRKRYNEISAKHYRARRGGGDEALAYRAILMGDPCSYCGAPSTEADHIVPVDADGSNAWDNLTASCRSCNARKRTRPLLTFLLAKAS